jgi:hypothetical protein
LKPVAKEKEKERERKMKKYKRVEAKASRYEAVPLHRETGEQQQKQTQDLSRL